MRHQRLLRHGHGLRRRLLLLRRLRRRSGTLTRHRINAQPALALGLGGKASAGIGPETLRRLGCEVHRRRRRTR